LRQGAAVNLCSLIQCWKLQLRKPTVETQGTIFNKRSQIMAYADVDLMERRLQNNEVFTSLEEQTNKIGLEIKKKKKVNDSNTEALQ
jgi:hypothetical protein